jgi:hypothetical protein
MALIIPYPAGPFGRFWVRNDGYFMTDVLNAKSDAKVIERIFAIMDWNKTSELAFPAPRKACSFECSPARQMSPAPAGKVALSRTATNGGEAASGCAP